MVGHNVNKQRNHIMNENKPKVATWVLCVDIDPDNNPEYEPTIIGALSIPLDTFKGGLIGVTLASNMGEDTALAARIACQTIDIALKRHLERGGGDAVEMLGLHIDPMGDIRDARP